MEGDGRLAGRIQVGLNKKAAGRRFGFSVGVAFLLLTSLLIWRDRDGVAVVTCGIGSLLITAGLAVPTMLHPVERAWMAMAHAISRVTTPIVLGIVYFLLITPIGLVVRAGKRSSITREEPVAGSYWITTSKDPSTKGGMTRQF